MERTTDARFTAVNKRRQTKHCLPPQKQINVYWKTRKRNPKTTALESNSRWLLFSYFQAPYNVLKYQIVRSYNQCRTYRITLHSPFPFRIISHYSHSWVWCQALYTFRGRFHWLSVYVCCLIPALSYTCRFLTKLSPFVNMWLLYQRLEHGVLMAMLW